MHPRLRATLIAIGVLSASAEAPLVCAAFPETLEQGGTSYKRLEGAALAQAVRGRTFCPTSHCSGIDGLVEKFWPNGNWSGDGDRWNTGGRYLIENARIVVIFEEEQETFAVYVSPDGAFHRAIRDSQGKVWLRNEFNKLER